MTNLLGNVPVCVLDFRPTPEKRNPLFDVDLTHPFLLANDLDLIA
jgi:hypothetical protein